MAGLETPPKGLQDGLHSHSNCRCIHSQRAPADPEKKTCTFSRDVGPMLYNPCREYILHPQRCAKNHTIAANELLTEPIQNCVRGKAEVGFLKATSVGPALLPGGNGDAQGTFATHRNRTNTSASVIGCRELGDSNSPRAL